MEAQILNSPDDPRWEEVISAPPAASFFHGAPWARVSSKTCGHRPFYLRCGERCGMAAPALNRLAGTRLYSPLIDSSLL